MSEVMDSPAPDLADLLRERNEWQSARSTCEDCTPDKQCSTHHYQMLGVASTYFGYQNERAKRRMIETEKEGRQFFWFAVIATIAMIAAGVAGAPQ